jgi:hypothetical protein
VIRREFTVSGAGTITLPVAASNIVVGLPYRARYKSSRLAYGAEQGTAMMQKKKVEELGLVLTDFARAGILYGGAFDNADQPMFPLPLEKDYVTAAAIVSSDVDDEEPMSFDGEWTLDSRVCIECASPFPASVLGMLLTVSTSG